MNFRKLVLTFCLGCLLGSTLLIADDNNGQGTVQGGGTSIVTGGTGAPSFSPVITKFALHWRDGHGTFDCLALTPSAAADSPGSGNFDKNIMYVVGQITSAEITNKTAVLKGTATVTGLGAGSNLEFTLTVGSGGPGATFVLTLPLPGLTFKEVIINGQITF